MERIKYPMSHEWHVAVNRHHDGKIGTPEWNSWMYEAMRAADETPRLIALFKQEREGALPNLHKQCSMSEAVPVAGNHLTCCMGVKCKECPALLALEKIERVTPDDIDTAKAWTCVAHILSEGGDFANEGYVLRVDDRMFWDTVHANLAASEDGA